MRAFAVALVLVCSAPSLAAPKITVKGSRAEIITPRYVARLDGAALVYFKDRATNEILLTGTTRPSPYVRFIEKNAPVTARPKAGALQAVRAGSNAVLFTGSAEQGRAYASVTVMVQALDHELVISGSAKASGRFEGVASIGLPFGSTSPDTDVLVPVSGGLKFSSRGWKSGHSFEWPLNWEAAMLQVHGRKGGLLACAYEPFKRFKNAELVPDGDGWSIVLESENAAPFEGKRDVQSLEWHILPYQGQWQVGTGIYRDWHDRTFRPQLSEDPKWVRDIRAEIHCGMDLEVLDALVKAGVDPPQTLLYVASWRTNGYDINYPDYTPSEKLAPFMEKARKLGFRVMLHVNYFGCDPKMPDYERFKGRQFRHKYSGDLQWWQWPFDKEEPDTKFAYIDPADPDWRSFFVRKMVELIGKTGADALHLDQTLCIFNDKNGLINAINSAEGNLLLHKEFKTALPQVAISGEGLDEVTMIHEAFAQRHVFGIDHAKQVAYRNQVAKAHPISAYLFNRRTTPYQYLGSGSPDNDQFWLAWKDAYRKWGVVPGLAWPSVRGLEDPSPGTRQSLDEIGIFQTQKLSADIDKPWPPHLDFLYKSVFDRHYAYVTDRSGWALCSLDKQMKPAQEFSRTIVGVDSAALPGTIPGWICFDEHKLAALDRDRYYVYLPASRYTGGFHVLPLEPGWTVDSYSTDPWIAWARLKPSRALVDLSEKLATAGAYWRDAQGKKAPLTWEITERTGSSVQQRGSGLFMHPPWKPDVNASKGATGITFQVNVPKSGSSRLVMDCCLDTGAEGNSDGVLFRATVASGRATASAQVIASKAEPVPLSLDLGRFAGKAVLIDLVALSGPKHNSSYDWGLVKNLRIVGSDHPSLKRRVHWPSDYRYMVAPAFRDYGTGGAKTPEEVSVPFGGTVMGTSFEPESVSQTVRIATLHVRDQVSPSNERGNVFTGQYPLAFGPQSVGGIEREGIFAHPPERGSRLLHYFVSLPAGSKATLKGFAGIRDNSKSAGVRFAVWANGRELWSKHIEPADGWQTIDVPIPAQSSPFILTLVTDSEGSFYCDWAVWGEPVLEVR